MRYFDEYPEYIPVAKRRANAERKLQQLRKTHAHLQPVIIEGRALAKTWWGKSWNSNLERYADFAYRMERGRSYARHRAVLDLQLQAGQVTAMVLGSSPKPYDVVINIDTLSAQKWATIRETCEGHFDSLKELLAGAFPQALKDLFYEQGAGLFPAPREIRFTCSCPDVASMCKHIAAALYGVGARLDDDPSLFFTLRGINIDDLITQTVSETTQTLLDKAQRQREHVLEDVDLGEVFGIQLDNIDAPVPNRPPVQSKASPTKETAKAKTATVARKSAAAGKKVAGTGYDTPRKTRLPAGQADPMSAAASTTRKKRVAAAPPHVQQGTMLDTLIKAVGKARKGKSVDQLQDRLGWTKIQVRNAISRAGAKGLIETVRPGIYRQKV